MKSLLSLVFSLFLIGSSFGQISERQASISLGDQTAFTMQHDGADKKMVEKALEEAIKEFGKVKRNKKAKEWSCMQCKASAISSSPLDIYYKVEEGNGAITSLIFFSDGTKFISSENDGDAGSAIQKIYTNIGYDVETRVITKKLKKEEDNLKDYEKDLSKLEKKNKKLHEDIEDYKKKIAEAEKDIEQNLLDQEDKKLEIEKQETKVGKVTEMLNNVGKSN